MEAEQRETAAKREVVRTKGHGINDDIRKIEQDIKSLDTQQGQQLNLMKKSFPEIADGWDWIQAHQDEFEKEVFGPPMISCSIKDERYSDQVQSLLQADDLTCFTAQTKNDYKKLTDQLYRQLSLSVVIRTCAHPLSAFQPPVSQDEATSLGLDGFAIDFLEGPAPVLAMLCAERRLHQSGVSLKDHSDGQYERLVNNGKVNQWAAGKQSFVVRRRREYGPQAMTTITKSIQPGKCWTSQPVDAQEKQELNRRLTELKGEKEQLREEFQAFKAKLGALEEQKGEIVHRIVG